MSAANRVLIVDPDRVAAERLEDHLTAEGYQVDRVDSGQEALALLRGCHYRLAFLDMMLPDMYGTELLEEFKEGIDAIQVACIITCDYAYQKSSVTLDQVGAVASLVKPLNLHEVSRIIRHTVA